eukprot:PhM_4_TR8314/c0_g1_i3/m.77678
MSSDQHHSFPFGNVSCIAWGMDDNSQQPPERHRLLIGQHHGVVHCVDVAMSASSGCTFTSTGLPFVGHGTITAACVDARCRTHIVADVNGHCAFYFGAADVTKASSSYVELGACPSQIVPSDKCGQFLISTVGTLLFCVGTAGVGVLWKLDTSPRCAV